LANQIAAGEVVERPASVIKELVENSIDAGASKIEVDIEGGGLHLMRVRDNGCGITKEDLILAFSRHATSKIRIAKDLAAITSMGFRGEALASIASVSRCCLMSKTQNQDSAWQIQIGPDLTPLVFPVAHPTGTTVEVADLFYNTPVRRKFLRSEKTEFQAIDEVLKRLALGNPRVSFYLKHQSRQIRYYAGVNNNTVEATRVAKICGQSFMEQAIFLELQATGLHLRGWGGLPQIAKRQADCQFFFVNGRSIKDRVVNHAIKMIYQQLPQMCEGTYPSYVLYLTLDPEDIDVNVHPTKHEVRFSQARLVHDFISKCLSETLQETKPLAQKSVCSAPKMSFTEPSSENVIARSVQRYTLLETDTGLVIVDLIKAKESLASFYFTAHWGNIPSQPLLFPLTIKARGISAEVIAMLAKVGFLFRAENSHITLLQQPQCLEGMVDERLLQTIVSTAIKQDINTLCQVCGKILPITFPHTPEFLKKWIETVPQGPWVHLTHAQVADLFTT